MDGQKFLNLCIEKISKQMGVAKENILVVWSCKVLQNNKALLGISGSNDAYYEFTYNGEKKNCTWIFILIRTILSLRKLNS